MAVEKQAEGILECRASGRVAESIGGACLAVRLQRRPRALVPVVVVNERRNGARMQACDRSRPLRTADVQCMLGVYTGLLE